MLCLGKRYTLLEEDTRAWHIIDKNGCFVYRFRKRCSFLKFYFKLRCWTGNWGWVRLFTVSVCATRCSSVVISSLFFGPKIYFQAMGKADIFQLKVPQLCSAAMISVLNTWVSFPHATWLVSVITQHLLIYGVVTNCRVSSKICAEQLVGVVPDTEWHASLNWYEAIQWAAKHI